MDSRVTVSMTATASAISPATWPVSPGCPKERAEESDTGLALRLPPSAWIPGAGVGVAAGLIAGNRRDALPGPMSELETPLRFGIGPSGSAVSGEAPADDAAGDEAGAAVAEVTATVSAADGGVHLAEVTMLAVAVSCTEVTVLALAATGICAWRIAGCLSDTELTTQVAAPAPLAQPPVNVAFWPDGWALRARVTSEADPLFPVETCTT